MLLKKVWPALLWASVVMVLIAIPGDYITMPISFWNWLSVDKVAHVIMFSPLSFLLLYGLREQYYTTQSRLWYVVLVLAVTLAYGLLTEGLQKYVFIGRNGNIYDVYADFIGAILGWLAFQILFLKKIRATAISNKD